MAGSRFGGYPEVGLVRARELADDARALTRKDIDPIDKQVQDDQDYAL
jgi:hypothetical protein